jgi:hypothetical protein
MRAIPGTYGSRQAETPRELVTSDLIEPRETRFFDLAAGSQTRRAAILILQLRARSALRTLLYQKRCSPAIFSNSSGR